MLTKDVINRMGGGFFLHMIVRSDCRSTWTAGLVAFDFFLPDEMDVLETPGFLHEEYNEQRGRVKRKKINYHLQGKYLQMT